MLADQLLIHFEMIQAAIAGRRFGHRTKGIDDLTARAVIERQCQNHPAITARRLARVLHLALHRFRQLMLPPDVFQANLIFVEGLDLRLEEAAEQAHQEVHFRPRTFLPVFFGERVERQCRNANARRRFHRRTHRCHASTVPGHARHVPPPRPAPVSVHDDGDMPGKPCRIKPQISFRFVAVHPSRNCVSQADLCKSKLTHELQSTQSPEVRRAVPA